MELDDEDCDTTLAALQEFHWHKSAIMDACAWVGKGNGPINNWYIPKLELLQSILPNIQANGAPIQFSADIMEHAHITEIKIQLEQEIINSMNCKSAVILTVPTKSTASI